MNERSDHVGIILRLVSTIYDLLLLIGVWFFCGSILVFLSGGSGFSEIIGLITLIFSSWFFYAYFWVNGCQTLSMKVWKIRLISTDGTSISYKQTLIRFSLNIITLWIPLLLILFKRNKITIIDRLSKTMLIRG